MPVDYDALAQQHGGTAVVDYDALAAQHGGSPTSQQQPQEGFFRSAADQLGIPQHMPSVGDVGRALFDPRQGPGAALINQARQSFDQIKQAAQAAKEGNKAGVLQHAVTAIPIVGPALDKGADQYADQNYAGEAGTLAGAAAQAAPMVLGAADAAGVPRPNSSLPNLVSKFPTRAKAGEIFNSLNTALKDQPVPLTSSAAPLQRATEIAVRGGSLPGPVNALLQRTQMTEPLTFPEARDYQASLSDLSGSDKLAMNGRMKGAVAQLSKALYDDLHTAAEAGGGLGEDYANAMNQYRQASRVKDFLQGAKGQAVKGAVYGAAGATGYNLLKLLQESK